MKDKIEKYNTEILGWSAKTKPTYTTKDPSLGFSLFTNSTFLFIGARVPYKYFFVLNTYNPSIFASSSLTT